MSNPSFVMEAGTGRLFEMGDPDYLFLKLKTDERFQRLVKEKKVTVVTTDVRIKDLVLKIKTGKPVEEKR